MRRLLVAGAGALGLLAAGCTPTPPTPSADWQMHMGTGKSCAATPGPELGFTASAASAAVTASATFEPAVENVDGVSEWVYRFPSAGGIVIQPTTGELGNSVYSIVLLFRLSDVSRYRRLVDVKDGSSDFGLYLYEGALRFYNASVLGARRLVANEWAQVVMTRTSGGTVTGYVDGVQQWQFTDAAGDAVVSGSNWLRFFIDNGTEHSAGAVARIRVFDRALSQTEINNLGQTPGSPCRT